MFRIRSKSTAQNTIVNKLVAETIEKSLKTPRDKNRQKNCTMENLKTHCLSPYLQNMNRILQKIGSKKQQIDFSPNQEDLKMYETHRYKELKQQFSKKPKKKEPFVFEFDEIVLDCYDQKTQMGKTSIWKKYRGHIDQLSYQVLKIRKMNHRNFQTKRQCATTERSKRNY